MKEEVFPSDVKIEIKSNSKHIAKPSDKNLVEEGSPPFNPETPKLDSSNRLAPEVRASLSIKQPSDMLPQFKLDQEKLYPFCIMLGSVPFISQILPIFWHTAITKYIYTLYYLARKESFTTTQLQSIFTLALSWLEAYIRNTL